MSLSVLILGFMVICLCWNWRSTKGKALTAANDALSCIINTVLCHKYEIIHNRTGASLPTVGYRWPHGQGDVAKFMHGRENSMQWREQYGPIYRIWSGMKPEVVLTKPEHIQLVYKDSDRHFKAINNNSGYFMSQLLGQCLGLISQTDWKRLRQATEPAFTYTASCTYTALIKNHVDVHFSRLVSTKTTVDILDPVKDVRLLPFWIVADIIYGTLTPALRQQLEDMIALRESLFRTALSGGLAPFSWSRFLPTKANAHLSLFKELWATFNHVALAHAKEHDGGQNVPVVCMFDQVDQGQCTREQLLQTIDEMLFANLDVTLGGLTWNFVQLAANSTVQSKLRDEVQAAQSSIESYDEYLKSSSTFLHAVMQESSRLRPLAAFSVPQSAPTARLLDGWTIPAGTDFVVDSYALNQLDEFWGVDSLQFRPERFVSMKSTKSRHNYWRFGFGPRQCLGRHVADIIVRAVLAKALDVFELSLVNKDEKWERDQEVWIDHPNMKLRCTKRN